MYLGIFNRDGEMLVHRPMPAGPAPLRKTLAPYRTDLIVCVACLFAWYWLADLCAREGIPCVLGHALSMQAMHGGQAKNDTMDAQKIAVLLRGGMLPHAYVSPAEMRARRALLRRRMPRMRQPAEWLAPIHKTPRQYTLPEIGKQMAYTAHRDGVAERFADPAVPKSLAVDLARIGSSAQLLRDIEVSILTAAKQDAAHTLSVRRPVPGIGAILRLVLL